MILRAIIENKEDRYHYRVRIPILNKSSDAAAATPYEQLYVATVATFPGVTLNFTVGDAVFVAFEKNMEELPVIIGQLARESSSDSTIDLTADSIQCNVNLDVNGELNTNEVSSEESEGQASSEVIEDIKKTVSSHTSQLSTISSELTSVKQSVEDMEESVTSLQNTVSSLQDSVETIGSEIQDVKESITSLSESVTSLTAQVTSLTTTKQDVIQYQTLTLLAASWVSTGKVEGDEYRQAVTIPGLTTNCIVNLLPDYDVLCSISADGTTSLYVGNDGTSAYAYALGAHPQSDLTVKYTLVSVDNNE